MSKSLFTLLRKSPLPSHPHHFWQTQCLLSLSGALLLIWKSSFFKKQTARTSKQAKTAYNYNCIRRPASSCPTFCPCLTPSTRLLQVFQSTTITSIAWEATESAWVDKRMCSDSQNGGASLIKVWSSLRWGVEFNATTLKTRFYQPWPHRIFLTIMEGTETIVKGGIL